MSHESPQQLCAVVTICRLVEALLDKAVSVLVAQVVVLDGTGSATSARAAAATAAPALPAATATAAVAVGGDACVCLEGTHLGKAAADVADDESQNNFPVTSSPSLWQLTATLSTISSALLPPPNRRWCTTSPPPPSRSPPPSSSIPPL